MRIYRCPACKTPLTSKAYKEALGILSEGDKHHEQELEEYQKKLREPQQREKRAKEEAIKSERERTERLLAAKEQEIQSLKERISQLCGPLGYEAPGRLKNAEIGPSSAKEAECAKK